MPVDKRPLAAYLRTERDYERALNSMLRQAATDVDDRIRSLAGRENIGSIVRRDQLSLVKKDILERHATLMTEIGRSVEAARLTAAADAIRVVRMYDADTLLAVGLSQEFVDSYVSSAVLTSKQGVASAIQRLQGASYVPLSQTVYRAEQWSSGLLDRYVTSALAQGLTWTELAKGVKDMIRPDVSGGVSYAAKRLARTEINNAAHAMSKEQYQKNPMVEAVKWNLSGSHPTPDECNEYAESTHFTGGGSGEYKPGDLPSKPHPQCLCFVTPVTPSTEDFINNLFDGKYDDGDYGDGIFMKAKEELVDPDAARRARAAAASRKSRAAAKARAAETSKAPAAKAVKAPAAKTPVVEKPQWQSYKKAELEVAIGERIGLGKDWLRAGWGDAAPLGRDDLFDDMRRYYFGRYGAKPQVVGTSKYYSGWNTTPGMKLKAATSKQLDELPRMEFEPRSLKGASVGANPKGRGFRRHTDRKDRGYEINCTRVSSTVEMRARGFDVKAAPAPQIKGTPGYDKGNDWISSNWIDPKTNTNRIPTTYSKAAELEASMLAEGEGARFLVWGPWSRGGAHIWNAEVRDGKLHFIEGQTKDGLDTDGLATRVEYLRRLSWGTRGAPVSSMRVDDLSPTELVMRAFE